MVKKFFFKSREKIFLLVGRFDSGSPEMQRELLDSFFGNKKTPSNGS